MSLESYENPEDSSQQAIFLEGTGSMVLDHENGIVYAVLSARTSESMLKIFCATSPKFKTFVAFGAYDSQGNAIYHTNVVMSMGTEFCIICLELVAEQDRERVRNSIENSGKKILPLTKEQCLKHMAGNTLLIKTCPVNKIEGEKRILVMSSKAKASLSED